jgi:hypothetical protein
LPALLEEGHLVDIVDAENLTTIKATSSLVVLEIPGGAGAAGVVVGLDVDLMRQRVVGILRNAPTCSGALHRPEIRCIPLP